MVCKISQWERFLMTNIQTVLNDLYQLEYFFGHGVLGIRPDYFVCCIECRYLFVSVGVGMIEPQYTEFLFHLEDADVYRYPLLLIYLILHFKTFQQLKTLDGRDLNRVLGQTARNIFLFGLLLAISVFL